MMGSADMRSFLAFLGRSLAAVLLSFAVSALIMLVSGYNPALAFASMIRGSFGSANSFANTLSKSVPLIFAGLACAYANKGGIFNIGCEGQLYMGAFVSTVTALSLRGMPRLFVIIASILTGMVAGAAVGSFNGFLKAKMKLNEVVVAIMLNYICRFFTSFFVSGILKDPDSETPQTLPVGEHYMFSKLIPKTQLTTALFLALIAALAMFFFFRETRAGYNVRAVGENGAAAEASGINVARTMILTMAVSGGLAGLTGVTEVFGKSERFIDGFSPGYGFTGIAIAFLAGNHPLGILLSALLFGIIQAGSMKMSYEAGVSTSMISVIQGLVILFVATPELVSIRIGRRRTA